MPAVVIGCYLQASEIVFICAALAKRFGVGLRVALQVNIKLDQDITEGLQWSIL